MICFDEGNRRFNYRIVGVAVHDDAVLLHRAGGEPFWTLPGGRAEHGESAAQTIRREMIEELATEVEVDRLLWIVENFFEYCGLSYHELALYFLIRFPPDSLPLRAPEFAGADGKTALQFKWVPIRRDTLEALPLYPEFLSRALGDLPATVVHIVEREQIEGRPRT